MSSATKDSKLNSISHQVKVTLTDVSADDMSLDMKLLDIVCVLSYLPYFRSFIMFQRESDARGQREGMKRRTYLKLSSSGWLESLSD